MKIAEPLNPIVVETCYAGSPMNFVHRAFTLTLTYQVQRKTGKARKINEAMVAQPAEINNPDMLQTARAFEAVGDKGDILLSRGKKTSEL